MLFESIIRSLELEDAYNEARAHFSSTDTLIRTVERLGVEGLLDSGKYIDSSLTNPARFMKVTDALVEHLNRNLDTDPSADTILKALLNTEMISADTFIPSLRVQPGNVANHVSVACDGLGLSLSIYGSVSYDIDPELETEDILDSILNEETDLVLLGRLTVYSNDSLVWTPNVEASNETFTPESVEIPEGTPIVSTEHAEFK